jgi:hypothetical protein
MQVGWLITNPHYYSYMSIPLSVEGLSFWGGIPISALTSIILIPSGTTGIPGKYLKNSIVAVAFQAATV